MTLKEYLASNGKTLREFASESGIEVTNLSRYMSGRRTISAETVWAIQRFTNGKVQLNDWSYLWSK